MKILFTMRQFLSDDALGGRALPLPSWFSWHCLLIAAAGEKLTPAERREFRRLTGRRKEPGRMVEMLLVVAGRRSGKSKAASVFAIWCACCVDWSDCLSIGERGTCLICCPTERQGEILTDYIRAIISATPLLASLVEDETQLRFRLKRQASIEVVAASAKWTRGFSSICSLLDETAFLPSNEDAANSDQSILEAISPSGATTGAPIIITSSPATTTGIVRDIWQKHYGADGDPAVLVVQSDARGLNPTLRESVVARAFESDATAAQREFGGQFGEPLSAFISRETVMRCVERNRSERAVLPGLDYQCFVDAASGSGSDYFAAAIGHRARDADRDVVVLDCLFAERPPFDPLAVVAALCGHLQRWRIRQVSGDSYAGNFVPAAFAKHGITYMPSKLSASELYVASLPAFTSGTVALLDNPNLIDQLVNLRRRIGQAGREQVQHMRGQHDDLANAVCGLIHLLTPVEAVAFDFAGAGDTWGVITAPRSYVADSSEEASTYAAWARAHGRTGRAPDGGLCLR
jgi:hypothetical protein